VILFLAKLLLQEQQVFLFVSIFRLGSVIIKTQAKLEHIGKELNAFIDSSIMSGGFILDVWFNKYVHTLKKVTDIKGDMIKLPYKVQD